MDKLEQLSAAATQGAEVERLRDHWQFLADLLDRNIHESGEVNRVKWNGVWHEGPAAEAYHATFNAIRGLAAKALAAKGTGDE